MKEILKDVIVPIYVYFISIYFDLKPTAKNRGASFSGR